MGQDILALIAGSGLREVSFLKDTRDVRVETPYGPPAETPRLGKFRRLTVALLTRHGSGHRIPPHRINYRANLWALKELGAKRIIATSSTGSLKRSIHPGTFVVPHDFVSFWNIPTVYDDDVRHVTPALDEDLRTVLASAAKETDVDTRPRGIYVQTSGPRLETRAEIAHFRTMGDILGMTMASEATIASELGLQYASVCSVDNFCNGIVDRPLTFDAIRKTQERNADSLRDVVVRALEAIA